MSSVKKPITPKASLSVDPKKDRLLALQERDRITNQLVNKFAAKYAKDSKVNKVLIAKQVTEFLKTQNEEKISDENIKILEARIVEAIKQRAEGNTKGVSHTQHTQVQSQPNVGSLVNADYAHNDDADSDRPKSVYIQERNADEWAAIARYDTQKYKKELAAAKQREKDLKKNVKAELDKQIAYKKQAKRAEAEELKRYVNQVHEQVKEGEEKERKKMQDLQNKIMLQKQNRDQQLLNEINKKKHEKQAEKIRDDLLVQKLKQEMEEEARVAAQKRAADKEHMKKIFAENEEFKKKMAVEAKIQKELDIKAQQEYTRLVEKQMAEREAEVKEREERAKKFMSMMADTVVKDQKAQQLIEERKLLKNTLDKEKRDQEDEMRRKAVLNEKKREMTNYLNKQLEEKAAKKREEKLLEKKQAELWKKEAQDFRVSEKQKEQQAKENVVKNAEIQKQQILRSAEKQRKMNNEEALYNKPILRTIAVKEQKEHFTRKQLEGARH